MLCQDRERLRLHYSNAVNGWKCKLGRTHFYLVRSSALSGRLFYKTKWCCSSAWKRLCVTRLIAAQKLPCFFRKRPHLHRHWFFLVYTSCDEVPFLFSGNFCLQKGRFPQNPLQFHPLTDKSGFICTQEKSQSGRPWVPRIQMLLANDCLDQLHAIIQLEQNWCWDLVFLKTWRVVSLFGHCAFHSKPKGAKTELGAKLKIPHKSCKEHGGNPVISGRCPLRDFSSFKFVCPPNIVLLRF